MHHKLIVFLLVLVLSLAAVLPAAATPCAFGAAYDPACDVDQDGDIDVLDIQLTAGHWNQTGAWTGGGDGWLLSGNAGTNPTTNYIGTTDGQPLVMQPVGGNVGIGTRTPGARFNVVGTSWFQGDSTPLPAAAGKGIAIGFTGEQGYIYGFDYATWTHKNLIVQHAGGKVVIGSSTPAAAKLTVVAPADETGIRVGTAGIDGIQVISAAYDGVWVSSAGHSGVRVEWAGDWGVLVGSAGYIGVSANTTQASGQWGLYTPDAIHGSNVLMHSLSLVAQVTGPDSLTPGDIVAVTGVADPVPGSTMHTPMVRLADETFSSVVGVVEGHLALVQHPDRQRQVEGEADTKAPQAELRTVDGQARSGDYVAITVLGAALVRVQDGGTVLAGQRLTAGDGGSVRALQSRTVEGMAVSEGAPVLGVAMQDAKDGMVWVLVNPQ